MLFLLALACISSIPTDTSMSDDSVDTGCYDVRWTRDADTDGYGAWDPADPESVIWTCIGFVPTVSGYVAADGDCDDTRRDTYPGAPDAPGDNLDSNCDGVDG